MELSVAQKIRLGAFLLVGGIAVVGTLVVLMGLSLFENRDSFRAHFEQNVSGLEVSAPVKYRGLRIGRVDAMRIAPDNPAAIEVEFSVEEGITLYQGTRAALDASGLTGLKSINLVGGGDPEKGRIEPGTELATDPAFLDQLVDQAENVAARMSEAATYLTRWTRDENRERFEKLIISSESFMGSADRFLTANAHPMAKALEGIASATEGITTLTTTGADTLHKVQTDIEAVSTAVRRSFEQLDPQDLAQSLRAFRRTMETLNARLDEVETGRAITRLTEALDGITRLADELDLAVRSGREDFRASLSYMRQAAEDLREFSRIIAQDPSTLVRGRE